MLVFSRQTAVGSVAKACLRCTGLTITMADSNRAKSMRFLCFGSIPGEQADFLLVS